MNSLIFFTRFSWICTEKQRRILGPFSNVSQEEVRKEETWPHEADFMVPWNYLKNTSTSLSDQPVTRHSLDHAEKERTYKGIKADFVLRLSLITSFLFIFIPAGGKNTEMDSTCKVAGKSMKCCKDTLLFGNFSHAVSYLQMKINQEALRAICCKVTKQNPSPTQ
jgi:hypothetical protein